MSQDTKSFMPLDANSDHVPVALGGREPSNTIAETSTVQVDSFETSHRVSDERSLDAMQQLSRRLAERTQAPSKLFQNIGIAIVLLSAFSLGVTIFAAFMQSSLPMLTNWSSKPNVEATLKPEDTTTYQTTSLSPKTPVLAPRVQYGILKIAASLVAADTRLSSADRSPAEVPHHDLIVSMESRTETSNKLTEDSSWLEGPIEGESMEHDQRAPSTRQDLLLHANLCSIKPIKIAKANSNRLLTHSPKRTIDCRREALVVLLDEYSACREALLNDGGKHQQLGQAYYQSLAELGVWANRHGQIPGDLEREVQDILRHEDLFHLVSSATSSWVRWPKRTSDGVAVAGELLSITSGTEKGQSFVDVRTKTKSQPILKVSVADAQVAQLKPGTKIIILGKIAPKSLPNTPKLTGYVIAGK